MSRNCLKTLLFIAVLLLAGCSEPPKETSTEKVFPSEPVTGKTAFWELYKSAHSWAADLVPLKLESKTAAGKKNEAGKAAIWVGTFGSPKRREAILITYAVAPNPPDTLKGINVGHPFPWGGPTPQALAFQTSDLVTDSDAAYKTASEQAAAWVKKHPDKTEATIALGHAARFPAPVWYIQWGDSKNGYGAFINAKTGEVVKPGK